MMKMVKLKTVCKTTSGGTPSRDKQEFWNNGTIPWIKSGQLKDSNIYQAEEFITVLGLKSSSTKLIPAGTLLLALYGATAGKLGFIEIEATINQAICALMPNPMLLSKQYLYYYLLSIRKIIINDSAGGAQPNISQKYVQEIEIPLPPLEKQQQIAHILDKADALRRKDRELLQQYDALAQAIFIEMFGDPVRNERGWAIKKLGDCIAFMTSGSRGWAQYYSDSGDIFLRINNVGYNELRLNDLAYVNAPESAESKRIRVKTGDILLSVTADLGRTGVIPNDFPKAFINQHLALIRMQSAYNPHFVSQVFATEYGKHQFQKLTKGGVKAGLNFDDVKSLEFPNPPVALQESYFAAIQQCENMKKLIKKNIQYSETLFQSLLQGAFSGRL